MNIGQVKKQDVLTSSSVAETSLIELNDGQKFILKKALVQVDGMFEQEAAGLKALRDSGCVKTPDIIKQTDDYLLLEYIKPEQPQEVFWRKLGQELAKLHQSKVPQMGLSDDNFIGMSPQKNTPHKIYTDGRSWRDFFWEYRIEYQLKMLRRKNAPKQLFELFDKTKDSIYEILAFSEEEPCLLHGDLWKGNVLCGKGQTPYLIDPAIYYGHRETDIAMTKLFGGFHYVFYESYQIAYPLKPGWAERVRIYQLYHLLNHWNLFGDSYSTQVYSVLEKL